MCRCVRREGGFDGEWKFGKDARWCMMVYGGVWGAVWVRRVEGEGKHIIGERLVPQMNTVQGLD